MQSERRLHPSAIVFGSASQLKNLALPMVVAAFGAGGRWLAIVLVLLAGGLGYAVARYFAFRYRFEADELVVRDGVLFRSERHVPYARIQNLDSSQHFVHRWFGVLEVSIQTGGGSEPEVELAAVRPTELDDLRARVFAQRRPTDEPAAAPEHELVALTSRDLVIAGLAEYRGFAVIAAGIGVLWEVVLDPLIEQLTGEPELRRRLIEWLRGGDLFDPLTLAGTIGALLVLAAGLSIAWAVVRLHAFRVRRRDHDLQIERGLLTRVRASIPLRRIQTLTIGEGPVHRWFARITVEARTAGGAGGDTEAARTQLAPVYRRADRDQLLAAVLPELALDRLTWRPLAPRAGRRVFRRALLVIAPLAAAGAFAIGAWTLVAVPVLVAVAALHARAYVRHARWAVDDAVVAFRHGWVWRRTTVARLAKLQVVTLDASPFDRRHAMAGVGIDTAGAVIAIPYLPHATAASLHARLATAIAHSEFRW